MNCEDVARWGGKLHGPMRGRDDGAKGVERGPAEEDIIRCGCLDDLDSVNVAAGGNFFSRKAINWFIVWDHGGVGNLEFLVCCPVKDVDGTALVDKYFFDCVILYFNGNDYRVVLLVVEAVEVVVREGYGWHAASVMGMGNVVD